ncbi:uncharacterized protein LOC128734817 [Sabethes cyaneus]|uniref:uncharacterized protein LOC128734817 n=1 Tax=Sabethes cyaneus TaxID=53552 RepID=UPI00237E409E|nr:uncharacterized protein LOC128734817 [Sabethes cyaneus]
METRSLEHVSGTNVLPDGGPNICRICLINGNSVGEDDLSKEGMDSIFSTIGEYEQRSLYAILVTICVPLREREMLKGVPERICRACKWRLLSAFELYETCLRNDEKMRSIAAEMLNQSQDSSPENEPICIKQEPDREEAVLNHDVSAGLGSSMQHNHDYPEAESPQIMAQSDLPEEMALAMGPDEFLFKEHYRLSEKGNHYCGICNGMFPSKYYAWKHILSKHDPAKPFKCDVCHFTLMTELELIKHEAAVHGLETLASPHHSSEDTKARTEWRVEQCEEHPQESDAPGNEQICIKQEVSDPEEPDLDLSHSYPKTESTRLMDQSDLLKEMVPSIEQETCEEKLPEKRHHKQVPVLRLPPKKLAAESDEKHDYKCNICSETFAMVGVFNMHMKLHQLLAAEKEKKQRKNLEMQTKQDSKSKQQESLTENNAMEGIETSNVSNVRGAGMESSSSCDNKNNTSVPPKKKNRNAPYVFVCIYCNEEFKERDALLKHREIHKGLQLYVLPEDDDTRLERVRARQDPEAARERRRVAQALRRAQETSEQKQKRQRADATRNALRRSQQTTEQRRERRNYDANRHAKRRGATTKAPCSPTSTPEVDNETI